MQKVNSYYECCVSNMRRYCINICFARDRYAQAGIDLHTQHSDFELKESARKEVLVLWSATENIIMTELSRHFVEKDVEDMEDDVNNLDDDDDDCQSPKLNRRSSGNFFGLNFQQTELGEIEDLLTVCPPSCRLAAPVYKDIMSFSAKVKALFREEIDDHITVDSIIEKSVVRCVRQLIINDIACVSSFLGIMQNAG